MLYAYFNWGMRVGLRHIDQIPPPRAQRVDRQCVTRLIWQGNNLLGIQEDGTEEMIGRFYDSTTSRIIHFLMERPGQVITREKYNYSVSFEFRLTPGQYFRKYLKSSLMPSIFATFFHARSDWAIYTPKENGLGEFT
jgi:hypothetical protein